MRCWIHRLTARQRSSGRTAIGRCRRRDGHGTRSLASRSPFLLAHLAQEYWHTASQLQTSIGSRLVKKSLSGAVGSKSLHPRRRVSRPGSSFVVWVNYLEEL